ncbi:MAG: hypothetical protein KDK24_09050 [Pseudooceanicola sp.]|nr:hypothetical protein [Pseudooceanicola sp.]
MIYSPDLGPYPVKEAEVLPGTAVSPYQPLVARWPDAAPVGCVIFCHGLGSNGREYANLSRYWASHGYLALHPTFADSIIEVAKAEPALGLDPDSDLTGWTSLPEVRARMHQKLHSPAFWLARVDIVQTILEMLDSVLAATCGAADLPLAIAGHSFGAFTTQLLAGAEIDLPDGPRTFRDNRFRSAIILSGQGRDQQGLRDGSWDGMAGPVLTVTGTRDMGAKGGDWHWKCEPFDLAPPGGKYLAVLENGDHYLGGFADRQPQVPAQIAAVNALTLAFLDATLRQRGDAADWLNGIGTRVGDAPLIFKTK